MKKNIISKIELSQLSGLKPPTISNIFNQVIEEKLIVFHSKGEPNSNGGPKPDLYVSTIQAAISSVLILI
jgi:hypothetical protein